MFDSKNRLDGSAQGLLRVASGATGIGTSSAACRLRLRTFARNALGKKEFFEERVLRRKNSRVMRQGIARGGYTTGKDSASASRQFTFGRGAIKKIEFKTCLCAVARRSGQGLGLNEGKTEGEGRPTVEQGLVERESEGLVRAEEAEKSNAEPRPENRIHLGKTCIHGWTNSVLDSWDKDAIRACRWAIASQTAAASSVGLDLHYFIEGRGAWIVSRKRRMIVRLKTLAKKIEFKTCLCAVVQFARRRFDNKPSHRGLDCIEETPYDTRLD
ncbi:hypothetical protein B0H14DRAFT_2642005 [Mycena olivaceomarginata]|nr:hypothetical protein B0H14DRAFT_2642005 [Mycena olivaceomarginata]